MRRLVTGGRNTPEVPDQRDKVIGFLGMLDILRGEPIHRRLQLWNRSLCPRSVPVVSYNRCHNLRLTRGEKSLPRR